MDGIIEAIKIIPNGHVELIQLHKGLVSTELMGHVWGEVEWYENERIERMIAHSTVIVHSRAAKDDGLPTNALASAIVGTVVRGSVVILRIDYCGEYAELYDPEGAVMTIKRLEAGCQVA